MLHGITAQEDERTGAWQDVMDRPMGIVNPQRAAIGFAPDRVQIENARDHALIGREELISMAPIKRPWGEDGVMNLELDQTEEERLVERSSHAFDLGPVEALDRRWCALIPPEDHVASNILADAILGTAPDARWSKSALTPQAIGFFGQLADDPSGEKVRRNSPSPLNQLIEQRGKLYF
jgi:hypothetical protein